MAYSVTNDANDVQQLAPISPKVLEIAKKSDIEISTMVGDSGYCNAKQIQELETLGLDCVVGVPKVFQKEKDKENGITFEKGLPTPMTPLCHMTMRIPAPRTPICKGDDANAMWHQPAPLGRTLGFHTKNSAFL